MYLNAKNYIACICEGSAEEVILDILLDSVLLIFSRDSLLGGELIRTRGGEAFARKHLGLDLGYVRFLSDGSGNFHIPGL